jgi:ATP-dependent Zn protease
MNRAAIAYHEAGHAIVFFLLTKKPPRELTIVGTKDAQGQVKHSNLFRGIQLDVDNSDRSRLAAERNIMIALAGEIAQRKAFPRSIRTWQMAGEASC